MTDPTESEIDGEYTRNNRNTETEEETMSQLHLKIKMVEGYTAKREYDVPRDVPKMNDAWKIIRDGIENGLITGLEARITK